MVEGDDLGEDLLHAEVPEGHGGEDGSGEVVAGGNDGGVGLLAADALEDALLAAVAYGGAGDVGPDPVDGVLIGVDGHDVVALGVEGLGDAGAEVPEADDDEPLVSALFHPMMTSS